jgi:hypothetical protein
MTSNTNSRVFSNSLAKNRETPSFTRLHSTSTTTMDIRQHVRKAFSSKEEFKKAIQTNEHGTYFNEDLLPSPPCRSTLLLIIVYSLRSAMQLLTARRLQPIVRGRRSTSSPTT